MWVFRWIVGALLVIAVIGFAMQNADQTVVIKVLMWQSMNLPLWVVMYVAFAVGLLFWLLVSIFQILSLKSANKRNLKEIKKLKQELDRLRNVSVEDISVADKSSEKAVE